MTSTTLAPWRGVFLEHIGAMTTPEFTLGTVRTIQHHPSSAVTYTPRVRTCIFRGMFADMNVNPKNNAALNPDMYTSDLPTFTTDVRMDKMDELWDNIVVQGNGVNNGLGGAEAINGTGGGGLVEATWWADKQMTQWRIRGRAYVLAPDVDSGGDKEGIKDLLLSRMMLQQARKDDGHSDENTAKDNEAPSTGSSEQDWSFSREITAHFGNLSPGMRGTFRNPPPGKPVALPVSDGRLGLGQKVTDVDDELARKNFRVVVIVPHEVDRTDLSDANRGRRWLYRRLEGEAGRNATMPGGIVEAGWEKVEVWP